MYFKLENVKLKYCLDVGTVYKAVYSKNQLIIEIKTYKNFADIYSLFLKVFDMYA